MARRKDHTRDEMREMIVMAARSIVVREGIDALTARRIAAEIGYTAGTIYNVFSDMADVIAHVNGTTLDRLYAVLESKKHRAISKTPLENMKSMALAYMAFAAENPDDWALLFAADVPRAPEKAPWYQDKIDRLFHPLEWLLAPYFSQKNARKHKEAARTLWGAVHGLHILSYTNRLPECKSTRDLKNMIFLLLENFMAGLGTKNL